MAATVSAAPPLSPTRVGVVVDNEDSNISSPLSEVDDKDDNDEDIEHMQIDNDDEGTPKPSVASKKAASDSDSVLSDAHSDIHSDANDTEAETERLYDTPRHQRQRDVVVDQFNEGQIFEHTPSKLKRTANLDDKAHHRDDESLSGDEASMGSIRAPDDSPTKVVTSKDTSVDDESKSDPQERKRKRSPAPDPDPSEPEQPLKKRTSSGPEPELNKIKPVEDVVMHEDEPTPANETSGTQTPTEDAESSPRKKTIVHEDDVIERTTRVTKKNTRGSKRKGPAMIDNDHETEEGGHEGVRDGGADVGHHTEGAEADVDEEVDVITAHDEEMERKQAAFRDWTHIEEMFGIFRDRLYKDRLQRLEEEEQSLLASNPTHPEYLNMKQCLDDRLEQKLREINKELEYRIRAHENRSVAQRAQIWGQYFQAVREKREKTLEALNQEWYDVQTARRSAHSLEDVGLLFPKDSAQRVRNAIAYNTEVSALSSIAKYEGFPAVPEMKGASQTELEDDMAAIQQSRREQQKTLVQPRDEYHSTPFDRLGPAGEQFLRETPWANPNHLVHKIHPTSNRVVVPQVETVNGRATQQTPLPPGLAPVEAKPVAVGPNPKKQASPALSNRLSESPELTRSMLNPAHHQLKRVGALPGVNRGSKTAAT